MSEDDEPLFIGEDDEEDLGLGIPVSSNSGNIAPVIDDGPFLQQVATFAAFFPSFEVTVNSAHEISFLVPTNVLPTSMSAVYGFYQSTTLFEVHLLLNRLDWFIAPVRLDISNPVFGQNFIGRPLINDMINQFFGPAFRPRPHYKAEQRIFVAHGHAPLGAVHALVSEGHAPQSAEHALLICNNSIEQARNFLVTGVAPSQASRIVIEYQRCPPIYFALELVEAILDIPTCCCICRRELPIPGIRPTICTSRLCSFAFEELGIGNSVTQEIRRDPLAADLIFSIFSGGDMKFVSPAPPAEVTAAMSKAFRNVPPMKKIAQAYRTDHELLRAIGAGPMAVLRWVLLSLRSHIITLPEKLKISSIGAQHQFMTLLGSPDAEAQFRELKRRYGNMFLWHGSHGDRWCSIVRNGLKNATGTSMMINGSACGSGIYFAPESSTSWGYCTPLNNQYQGSDLGKNVSLIALCEVARAGGLRDHGWAWTLTDEKACVVRFLMVGNFSANTIQNPPSNLPTLKDILEIHADAHKGHNKYC